MPDDIQVEVHGLEELKAAFDKFPQAVAKNMRGAAMEAYKDQLMKTQGLQNYPPSTAANQPPTPYYVRGVGTQTAKGNLGNSENLGKQWYIKAETWTARIGNRASYAQHAHGEKQARAMGRIGWRKLYDVAKEKLGAITKVYNNWIAKTLREVGLK